MNSLLGSNLRVMLDEVPPIFFSNTSIEVSSSLLFSLFVSGRCFFFHSTICSCNLLLATMEFIISIAMLGVTGCRIAASCKIVSRKCASSAIKGEMCPCPAVILFRPGFNQDKTVALLIVFSSIANFSCASFRIISYAPFLTLVSPMSAAASCMLAN